MFLTFSPAIFEGFVGAESEIDAIFEFEEANPTLGRTDFLLRESDSARPDGVAQSASPQTSASQATPTQRPSTSIQIPVTPRSPRAKANARSLDAAQSLTSPLAQIYMPVVVDEDTFGNAPEAPTSLAPGISYGPARRRLTSMHRRPGKEILSSAIPTSSTDSKKGVADDVPISESPDADPASQTIVERRPQTAEETEEAEEASSGVALATRLADIEKRQIRIEEILLNLVKQ